MSFASSTYGQFDGELAANGTRIYVTGKSPYNTFFLDFVPGSKPEGPDFATLNPNPSPGGSLGTGSGLVMAGRWIRWRDDGESNTLVFTGWDSNLTGEFIMTINIPTAGSYERKEPLRNIVKIGPSISFSSDTLGERSAIVSDDGTQLTLSQSGSSTGSPLVYTKE